MIRLRTIKNRTNGKQNNSRWKQIGAVVGGLAGGLAVIATILAVPFSIPANYLAGMELFATATPLPLTPASDNERLILIASFQYTEGIANTDAHNEIRRTIRDTVTELDISNLRIEVEPNTRLAAEAQAEAKEPGEQYNASMVVWGEDTGVRVTVNFLNLTEPDFDAAAVKITETELAQLANPSAYASFITTDLPAQLTFLSLFAVGQSYYVQEEYREAVRIIEKALASLPSDMNPLEGVDDAYF